MPAFRVNKFSAGRKDQMQVSYVEKNMVEQSSTVPNRQSVRSTETIPWA